MESNPMDTRHAEFRARDFRRIARDKLKGSWGIALGTSLLFMICGFAIEGIASGITATATAGAAYGYSGAAIAVGALLGFALSLAASSVVASLTLGHNLFYIDLCNNKANLSTLFSRFGIFLKAFGLVLFIGLFTFLWSLLFVIPGIIAAYRYSMAMYLMAQHPEMSIREAVNESKRLMAGHKGRLFCLQLSFIGWWFLAALTFGIGYLWLIPYIQTSTAAFYLDRTGQGIPLNAN